LNLASEHVEDSFLAVGKPVACALRIHVFILSQTVLTAKHLLQSLLANANASVSEVQVQSEQFEFSWVFLL
jgi:hypothetical protein